jgi:hypothetical protein
MTKVALTIFFLGVSAIAFAAEAGHRFVQMFHLPITMEPVIIAEGDLEPRSIGSYTMRIYKGRSAKFPTDEFITGVVRPRNGTIDAVRFADVDGDNRPDLIVVMRSAGSGGYLTAEAFRYHGRSLELIGSVAGFYKTADVIQVLREKLKASMGVKGH